MRRFTIPAALVVAGALALTGCAAQDGEGDADGGTAGETAVSVCETVAAGIRDISNGIQNTIASASPETQAEVEAYLSDAAERVDAFAEQARDSDFAAAVEDFADEVEATAEYVGELRDDEGEQDAEALAERQAALQEAAAEIREACTRDGD
jgi:hypothetical protein